MLFAPQLVFGTDKIWTGATNTTWGTGTNWTGSNPTSADNAVFNSTFSNQPNLGATATAGGIWMTGSVGQNLTISGSTLTLQGNTINGTAGLGILLDNANAFTLTINAPLTLGAAQSWTNNSGNVLTVGTGGVNTNAKALTINGSGNTTISGVVSSSGTITKAGNGTLTLSGANTYTGVTTVNAGTLIAAANNALGTNAHTNTVNSGGTLGIQGGITLNSNETISISGTGAAGRKGAIDNISGTNTIAGQITVAANSRIGVTAGALTLSGTVLLTAASTGDTTVTFNPAASSSITVTGKISDQGSPNRLSFDHIGDGTVTIANGTNDYWGNDIHVGTAGGGTTGILALGASNALSLANGAGQLVTIYSGTLDLNNFNATTNGLTLGGGGAGSIAAVTTGTGILTLNNNVTYNATNNPLGATIAGKLALGAATRGFSIGDSTNATADLTVSAIVSGAVGLTKTGAGTMVLSGANTYTGTTTVSSGVLNIQNATALGTTAGGTTVSSGAALQLQGSVAVGAEALTINSSGVGATGALRNISGTNSVSGTVTLGSASTIGSDAGNLTLSGVVSGGFALTKVGAGTLTLSGANTYTGGTAINGGTLYITSSGAIGSAGTISFGGGTLQYSASNTTDYSGRFSAAINQAYSIDTNGQNVTLASALTSSGGSLTKVGSGTLILSGVNTYTGGTTVSDGTLQMSAINRLLSTGAVTLSGGTFDLQTFGQAVGAVTLSSGSMTGSGILTGSSYAVQSGTISAILAGTGALTKTTSGTVTLSGANIFTGNTTVSAGTLQVNANNALGTTLNGTTVSAGAALKLNSVNYSAAEGLTLNGSGLSNGGALTNTGTSTFAGAINIATNATISAGGGTLTLTGGIVKNGTTLTFAGGGTVNVMTNGITGSSSNSDLIVDGTTVVLDAPNSYNGPTTVQNSGTLKLGANNVLPTSPQTAMTVNTSSAFDMASYSDGVASLAGDSTATVKNSVAGGTSTFTVNPANGVSTTFAGVIAGTNGGAQGNIALLKTGAGTLVLTGANTFSGSTTISGGTLTAAASGSGALGSTSSITVNSGGTLLLGASNQINNSATMTLAGGTFAKGNFSEGDTGTVGIGALTLTATGSHLDFGTGTVGVLSFASFNPGGHTLTIDNWTGTDDTVGSASTDRLIFDADQTSNLSYFSFTGYSGATEFALGNGYFEITPAPEPATYVAGFLALGALAYHQRRRWRCCRKL